MFSKRNENQPQAPQQAPQQAPHPGATFGATPAQQTPANSFTSHQNTSVQARMKERESERKKVKVLSVITAFAVVLAIAAVAFTVWSAGELEEREKALEDVLTTAVFAVEEIPSGTVIHESMLEVRDVPAKYASNDAVRSIDDIVGESVVTTVAANGQVTHANVYGPLNTDSLAATLETGMIAKTFTLDTETRFAGLLKQGDKVDIYLSKPDKSSGKVKTEKLLSGVEVIALDTMINYNAEYGTSYSTATFALSAEDSVKLTNARYEGDISMILNQKNADELISIGIEGYNPEAEEKEKAEQGENAEITFEEGEPVNLVLDTE